MKKFFVALIGGTVLLFGVAMIVLPGPGLPIIALGLAILSTEFIWARRAWRKTQVMTAKASRTLGIRDWLRKYRRSSSRSQTAKPV